MRRFLLATVVFCLPAVSVRAVPDLRTPPWAGEQCRTAIAAAERGHAIPPQLLAAIGHVESGRRNPVTKISGAWPWTINAEGQGSWFETKADAIKAVLALQASGVRSIDVGCMQVNLMHHPTAFTSLDMAFEPAVNADYAAKFLSQLHDQTGDWVTATADYHSSYPPEGEPYAAKVLSVWPEEQRKAVMTPLMQFPTGGAPSYGSSGHMLFASAVTPFPIHRPPRMLPLAGVMPESQRRMIPSEGTAPGALPFGMGRTGILSGTMPSPGAVPTAIMQAIARRTDGQNVMNPGTISPGTISPGTISPGRGLAFYRATPVPMGMPGRLTSRVPYKLTLR